MEFRHALKLVLDEYGAATDKHKPINSRHEGYAVIKEELDELWDEIKNDSPNDLVISEIKQVAAMCLRFMTDCC